MLSVPISGLLDIMLVCSPTRLPFTTIPSHDRCKDALQNIPRNHIFKISKALYSQSSETSLSSFILH